MVRTVQGCYRGAGKKIAIAASRFNDLLVQSLIKGAVDCLERHDVRTDDIVVVRAPGAFELPAVAMKLAESKKFDAVICLGCVIRGATPHYEYIAREAAKGIAELGRTTGIPVIFGVVTADTMEQAVERAGTKAGNRGADAAMHALELADLYQQIAPDGAPKRKA
jgi:6,7-dimethyl-8-ribityllumazine synthase